MAPRPWKEWLADGDASFQWGVHFTCKPAAFRDSLRSALRRQDIEAVVSTEVRSTHLDPWRSS